MKGSIIKKIIMSIATCALIFSSSFVSDAARVRAGALDSAVLQPASTGNVHTDEVVNIILSGITTPEMTTTQKVQACYSYLVAAGSLDPMGSFTYADRLTDEQRLYASEMTNDQFKAYGMLLLNTGDCYGYTAAFVALTRAIGLDSYQVYGLQVNNNGKMNNHSWCEINVNGTTYIFDPNLDEHISKGGVNKNARFCLKSTTMTGKYLEYPIEDEAAYQEYKLSNPYSKNMTNAEMTLLY